MVTSSSLAETGEILQVKKAESLLCRCLSRVPGKKEIIKYGKIFFTLQGENIYMIVFEVGSCVFQKLYMED